MRSLHLTQSQLAEMIAHVDGLAPLEGCGLLAGSGSTVSNVLPVSNAARSATRYTMNPLEQLRALEWIEANGLELLGIFHSHPAGPETVSPTDIAQAHYAVTYIVLARTEQVWRARGFWIADGQFAEVALRVK